MSKRTVIWSVVLLSAVAAAAVTFWLHRPEEETHELSYRKSSGDFMEFYVARVRKYGGTPPVTNALPRFEAEWEFADNPNGFHVFLPQKWKAELTQHFTAAFGDPTVRGTFPHLSYKEDRFNVQITVNSGTDPMPIICLKRGMMKRR